MKLPLRRKTCYYCKKKIKYRNAIEVKIMFNGELKEKIKVCKRCANVLKYLNYEKKERKPEYSCDKYLNIRQRRCGREPYAEVYPRGRNTWSYLCRWHYYLDVLRGKIFKKKANNYCILDKDEENDRYVD